MGQRPTSFENRDGCAPGRIDGGICHRDADEVDQGEAQSDGDRRKPSRGPAVRSAEDDKEEHRRHHDLGNDRSTHTITSGGVLAKTIGRKTISQAEVGLAAGDKKEHARPEEQRSTGEVI